MRTATACGVAAVLAGALAGCGSKDKSPSPTTPAAQESISAYAQRLQRALTTKGCPGLDTQINLRNESGKFLPCPSASSGAAARRGLSGFRVTGSAAYGTGAVVDYTAGEAPPPGSASYVLARGPSGRWAILEGYLVGKRTVGTSPLRAGYENVATKWLAAVRDSDCRAFFRWAVTKSKDATTACRKELPLYANLRKALQADPGAKPRWLGGNGTLGFFALETSKPRPAYRTLIALKSSPGASEPYLVFTTALGPATGK
jgi:hypothetical protein